MLKVKRELVVGGEFRYFDWPISLDESAVQASCISLSYDGSLSGSMEKNKVRFADTEHPCLSLP